MNIHGYLMTKNNAKQCLKLFKKFNVLSTILVDVFSHAAFNHNWMYS